MKLFSFLISFLLYVSSKCIHIGRFDYIIVGSGSGGSVLAYRLSKNPSIKVLLLEAGGEAPLGTEIPFAQHLILPTKINWSFRTVPSNKTAQLIIDRVLGINAGKVLGGSTIINQNLVVRGNKNDFDEWARNGAHGWDWDSVFPYFLKLEDNHNPRIVANGYHGVGGPIIIEFPSFYAPITKGYIEAAAAIGYPYGDFNAWPQTVFMPPEGTMYKGRRWSALRAYLEPARGRRNLRILTSAFVTKILINEDKYAYGVAFERRGKKYKAIAKQEVIVSAGTFNSPKLLQLSGIGRKEMLEKLHIPVIADLPVGENLRNHLSTAGLHFIVNTYTYSEKRITKNDYIEFAVNGTGPLTSLGGEELIGFVNSKYSKNLEWPDIEIYWTSKSLSSDTTWRALSRVNKQLDEIFERFRSLDTVLCAPFPTRPKSQGIVKLKSSNPHDDPLIDFRFYSDRHDLKIMVEGLKACLKMASTKALKRFDMKPLPYIIPGCERYERFSEEYLECMAIRFPFTMHHYSGTCKMGAVDDPTTVVDPTLKVKGVGRLRVVDTSIMPTQLNGHTNLATFMIGEKAADMILEDYEKNNNNDDLYDFEHQNHCDIHCDK